MITQTQIDDLNKLIIQGSILEIKNLVAKWQKQIHAKAAEKGDAVQFVLQNLKKDKSEIVVGKSIADNFAFHRCPFGEKLWKLTHVPTGVPIFSGKRTNVGAAIEDFKKQKWLATFDVAVSRYGIEALKHLSQDVVQEYREICMKARGT